ncbi:MAG: hypothetical protein GX162_07920 [Firmicutes bacterium]|jgi:hypothetical protein|nr:hypothetical protein [Bacillota bacterium]
MRRPGCKPPNENTSRNVPYRPVRYDDGYVRHGMQSFLAAFNIRTGKVTTRCGPTHKAQDLVEFMEWVAQEYADAKRMIVTWDNVNTAHRAYLLRWRIERSRDRRRSLSLYLTARCGNRMAVVAHAGPLRSMTRSESRCCTIAAVFQSVPRGTLDMERHFEVKHGEMPEREYRSR